MIHEQTPYLTVIDPASLAVLNRVLIGRGMSSIKVDTTTDQFYIGHKHSTILDVYSSFSLLPVDSIHTAGGTTHMTIDGEENNLHLVIPGKKVLMAVSLISKRMVATLDVGEDPYWVALMGER